MKLSTALVAFGASSIPQGVVAWGSLGHITTAYLASHLVSNTTESYLKYILYNDTSDYLANIATWADSARYTQWGRFTKTFHFIDAKDDPPHSCNVDLARDCKETGCVVTSLANYTLQSLDPGLSFRDRNIAMKFVVHFIGDLHQPLHNEDVARGGNGIHVLWRGYEMNLHHVWDSSIAEALVNGGRRGKPFELAKRWSAELAAEIESGKFAKEKEAWLRDIDLNDAEATALAWSRECNAYVCTHVLPEGPVAIVGQELSGEYYERAAPVVEMLVAKGGYRLAAWLDLIVDEYLSRQQRDDEL
ncbi:probable nuclease S1 precursor [Cephalotrichum gorgonifer]|uniref:Probable nuclease S1 n=1 Tax=Cephalotrichum gorgonifer TaxID=2041049 RepID=A0AAE8N026_9PEZI|nr:probable nuclease S1 precursor [Cephalotrichum gorgonifer]